jgi:hypothetical protein
MVEQKDERTTAIGLATFAFEYIDSAMLVNQARGEVTLLSRASYTPAYFLVLHGIELCLKSFLLHKGVELKVLESSYRHDLKKCLSEANKQGLTDVFEFTEEDQLAFDLLIEINKNNQLRYIQTGFKTYPHWTIVEPFAVRLHKAVAKVVKGRSFG